MKKYVKRVLIILVIALIFGYIGQELRRNWTTLSQIRWLDYLPQLFLHFLGLLFMQALMCVAWKWILQKHDTQLSLGPLIYSYFVPNLGKYIPGKVMFLAGRIEFTYRFGGTRAIGLSAFILEFSFAMLATGIFLPACLFTFLDAPLFEQATFYTLVVFAYLAVIFKSNLFFQVLNRLLVLIRQPPLAAKMNSTDTAELIAIYIVVWALYGGACSLLTLSVADLDVHYFLPVASIYIVAWLIGFLSVFTPGGLGVREAVIIFFLQLLIDSTLAALLALVARLTWTFAELGVSGLVLLVPVNFDQHKQQL
jgi:uncharacterized membrane protein YbhN (UPF0104 family)